MAKIKNFPKKPKKSASIATKEAYLKKVAEVKKYNAQVLADKKKSEALDKRIAEATRK